MKTQKIISFLSDFFRFDFFWNEFKKYSHFGGRTGRKEFWLFILTTIMIYIGIAKMAYLLEKPWILFWFEVCLFAPILSAIVRRLHDIGKSGYLIPFCLILSVVFFFSIGISFQNYISKEQLSLLATISLFIVLYPFVLLFKKASPNLNKYDTMPSHPYRHGFMAVLFILFLNGVVYLLHLQISNPQILSETSQELSAEELSQVDEIINKYKETH